MCNSSLLAKGTNNSDDETKDKQARAADKTWPGQNLVQPRHLEFSPPTRVHIVRTLATHFSFQKVNFTMARFSDHCATTTITIDLILRDEVLRTYTNRVRLLKQRAKTINLHVQMAEREMVYRARAAEECSKKAAEVADSATETK
jgi:hypothetical protein